MICQAQVAAIQILSDQIGQLDRQLRQRVARLAHRRFVCLACDSSNPLVTAGDHSCP
jgi:hypothetical protein